MTETELVMGLGKFITAQINQAFEGEGIYRYSKMGDLAFEKAAKVGGTVLFPPGNTSLSLPFPLTIFGGVKVQGAGPSASTLTTNITPFEALDVSATQTQRSFEGFKLCFPVSSRFTGQAGFHIGGFAFASFRELYISGFEHGILLENCKDQGTDSIGTWTENVRIDHVYFTGCQSCITLRDSAPTRVLSQSFGDQSITGMLVALTREGSCVLNLEDQVITYGGFYQFKVNVEAPNCTLIKLGKFSTIRNSFFQVFVEFSKPEYRDSFKWFGDFPIGENDSGLFNCTGFIGSNDPTSFNMLPNQTP